MGSSHLETWRFGRRRGTTTSGQFLPPQQGGRSCGQLHTFKRCIQAAEERNAGRPRVGGNQRVITDLGQRCFCAAWVGICTSRFGALRSGDRTDTTWRVICWDLVKVRAGAEVKTSASEAVKAAEKSKQATKNLTTTREKAFPCLTLRGSSQSPALPLLPPLPPQSSSDSPLLHGGALGLVSFHLHHKERRRDQQIPTSSTSSEQTAARVKCLLRRFLTGNHLSYHLPRMMGGADSSICLSKPGVCKLFDWYGHNHF